MVCLLKDTVKLSDEEGYVKETPNRKCVWTIETPQIFLYSLIREAHDSIRQKDMSKITDDAMVVEQEQGQRLLWQRDLIRILRSQHRRILISRKHF